MVSRRFIPRLDKHEVPLVPVAAIGDGLIKHGPIVDDLQRLTMPDGVARRSGQ